MVNVSHVSNSASVALWRSRSYGCLLPSDWSTCVLQISVSITIHMKNTSQSVCVCVRTHGGFYMRACDFMRLHLSQHRNVSLARMCVFECVWFCSYHSLPDLLSAKTLVCPQAVHHTCLVKCQRERERNSFLSHRHSPAPNTRHAGKPNLFSLYQSILLLESSCFNAVETWPSSVISAIHHIDGRNAFWEICLW